MRPFDTRLEFDERAVVGQADHLARQAQPHRIALDGAHPRIGDELLVAERDALGGRVVLEDDDVDVVADVHDFGRMGDPSPRHVRDVQQPVDAAEVDERAVVGEVLDRAAQHLALGQRVERGLLLLGVLFFEEDLAREHDVAALLVDLDDAHAQFLAAQRVEIAHGTHVDLRTGQERADADVHRQTALDALDDTADDDLAFLVRLLDLVPNLHLLGFFAREDDVAVAIFRAFEQDVDDVARLRHHLPALVDELFDRNDAFRFEADVDDDFRRRHFHDRALDDFTFRDVAEAGIVKFKQACVFLRVGFPAVLVRGECRKARVDLHTSLSIFCVLRCVSVGHFVTGPPRSDSLTGLQLRRAVGCIRAECDKL